MFSTQADVDKARGHTGKMLPRGYFQEFSLVKEADRLLKMEKAKAQVDGGNEAVQKRDNVLYDHEQILLFESVLSNAYSNEQRKRGGVKKPRHPVDTLTLGVILSFYFALGQRGMNVSMSPNTA